MKQCGWCLLLGKERVFNIRQLREHFDTDIIAGYLIGGVLESWLADAGETDILRRVKNIDTAGDVGGQLEFIFGVRPEKKQEPQPDIQENIRKTLAARAAAVSTAGSSGSSFGGSFRSSFRSELLSSALGSFSAGSFRKGSFYKGSFNKGLLQGGSFRLTQFGKIGSFTVNIGSLRIGSGFRLFSQYAMGSWRVGQGSGGSFSRKLRGSFTGVSGSGGSFKYYAGNAEITEEEYHRTLINLSSCPLNEYGYGIHLV